MRLACRTLVPLLLISFVIYFFVLRKPEVVEEGSYELEFGVSFSPLYAESLGLNPKEAYRVILDELKPQSVRLPIYWSEVEKADDQFDFGEIEWYLQEAGKRGIKVVLTVGYRNFRYPECYPPEWTKDLNDNDFEEELLEFLSSAVSHFSNGDLPAGKAGLSRTIEAWQVENEPFDLPIFRRWCRHFSSRLIEQEIEVVRANDSLHRPVVLTFGGEVFLRGLWKETIKKADIFGVSFYPRTVLPGGFVIQTYRLGPLSPRNITKERRFAANLGKKFWVVEMQAEPWGEKPETMSPEILKENYELLLEFGGAERVYFWGAEWWYKEMLGGRSEMWDASRDILNIEDGMPAP